MDGEIGISVTAFGRSVKVSEGDTIGTTQERVKKRKS